MSEQRKDNRQQVDARAGAHFSHGEPVCWSVTDAEMLSDRSGHAEETTLSATAAIWLEGTIREVGASTATVAFTGSDGRTGVAIVPLDRIHRRSPGQPCTDHSPPPSHTEHRSG